MSTPTVPTNVLPKLRIESLSKTYGEVVALQPTDLSVAAGEFLTLLGPSGSGKTTLLQMICGLIEPTAGRVILDGRDDTHTPTHQRDIGLVFQNYALFPHLSVAENIAFPLRMRDLSETAIAQRLSDALAMVQMEQFGHRFPRELSGGQQQRVALARCFVYQPSIILMDEPLGALDKKLREHMQIEIKRLHRETGATIIYVTHDQEEALAMSDRICLMNEARVEQIDTPRLIYTRPRTEFAARFIGISNILCGRVDSNGLLATTVGDLALPMQMKPGLELSLVVRPEHIDLHGDAENAVSGRVSEIAYLGSETRVLMSLSDGTELFVRLRSDIEPPGIGENVSARWRPGDATILPCE
ncbi:putative spermidine/putrescine transport system ATP-binding protein [Bradyrhizobium japonicum]|uniref:ABC transporter ATP-binding protein n=1 Tax=Bradyrhizobium japonicum TaxID=375 RepID=UPI0033968BFE